MNLERGMRSLRGMRRLLQLPSRTDRTIRHDVDDEVAFHLDMRAAELERGGLPRGAALARARTEFGDIDVARRALSEADRRHERESRRGRWWEEARHDVRYALRQLRRTPGFTFIAVLTLSLGIGATTAIFSAVDAILLRPLPFGDPHRLIRVFSDYKAKRSSLSAPDFFDYRTAARTLSGIAAYYDGTTNLTGNGEPERLNAGRVTANMFDVLGVRAIAGRTFAPGEDAESAPRVAILGEALWRRRFGADPSIAGRVVSLDGNPWEIVGVLPASAQYPAESDLWLPTRFSQSDLAANNRGARWLRAVGRLAPGSTLEQASAELGAVARRIALEDPKHNTNVGVILVPLLEAMTGDLRRPLLVLLGAVAFVLLIACANVASLLLGRTAARETEIALRAALGAARGRIARQLMTESLVLATLGGIGGIALGVAGIRFLVALAPAGTPRLAGLTLDAKVFAFAALAALLTGVIFGIVPALHASAAQLSSRLKDGARGSSGGVSGRRTRSALVVAELALSIMLLVGAGLLLRSFSRLRAVDPGFRGANTTSFTVTLPETKYPKLDDQRRFLTQTIDALRRIPGVEHVGGTFGLPLTDARFSISFKVKGRPEPSPDDEPGGQLRIATPEYFRTLGIPLLRGRGFAESDRWESPQVILISQELARRYFANEDPIGKHIEAGWTRDGHALGGEIVGIVGDVKQFGLGEPVGPAYYAAADQWPIDELTFVVRGRTSAAALASSVRSVVRSADPDMPIFDYRAVDDIVSQSLAEPRFYMVLLGSFAALALVLAAVGIYGVIAYAVTQRSREIGVRMALGATSARVLRMVVLEGLSLTIGGVVLGTMGALALTGVMQSLLFGVTPTDPATFGAVTGLLALVAVAACVIPARRAARVDPQSALRSDG